MLIESALIFLGFSLILVKSASYAVSSVVSLSRKMGCSEFFSAFFIAGFVAILPELFVGINAALIGTPEVGAGTIIGSNVADLTIVIGTVALVGRKIKIDKRTNNNMLHFLIATSLPILLMLDGSLSRTDGILLVVAFFMYMGHMLQKENFMRRRAAQPKKALRHFLTLCIATTVLFFSAHMMVGAAIDLSIALYVPAIIIGLFLVAIGTTLPELTFSLRAILAKHKEVALGDILGNVAADSTFTLGVVAIISPIATEFSVFATSALFMVFAAVLVVTLLRNGNRITSEEAGTLFFLYVIFAIIELAV